MHEVLVNRLGGLSLPRKSVVRLTDRPDMTLDVYRGRKTTKQQQQATPTIFREILEFQIKSFGFEGGIFLSHTRIIKHFDSGIQIGVDTFWGPSSHKAQSAKNIRFIVWPNYKSLDQILLGQ